MKIIEYEEIYQEEVKELLEELQEYMISTYDYKTPKLGRVTELIVTKEYRNKKIGKQLLKKIEEYFKEVGCKGILLNIFTDNKVAKIFYEKEGYSKRTSELIKQI